MNISYIEDTTSYKFQKKSVKVSNVCNCDALQNDVQIFFFFFFIQFIACDFLIYVLYHIFRFNWKRKNFKKSNKSKNKESRTLFVGKVFHIDLNKLHRDRSNIEVDGVHVKLYSQSL